MNSPLYVCRTIVISLFNTIVNSTISVFIKCCSHAPRNFCKTSNMITVPLSSCKFFMSMVYLSHIYNGSFVIYKTSSGAVRIFSGNIRGSKHSLKKSFSQQILKNNNGNILLLVKLFRNYTVPIIIRRGELEKARGISISFCR